MKQATLNLDLNLKKTRKREFLEQMEQVVPWAALVELIPESVNKYSKNTNFPIEIKHLAYM